MSLPSNMCFFFSSFKKDCVFFPYSDSSCDLECEPLDGNEWLILNILTRSSEWRENSDSTKRRGRWQRDVGEANVDNWFFFTWKKKTLRHSTPPPRPCTMQQTNHRTAAPPARVHPSAAHLTACKWDASNIHTLIITHKTRHAKVHTAFHSGHTFTLDCIWQFYN